MTSAAVILSSLLEDEEYEIDDTTRLTVEMTYDEDTSINDYDCYGRMEWTRNDVCGHSVRPDDFDGRARIMDRQYNETLWWQPAEWEFDPTHIAEDFAHACRLNREGFGLLRVTLFETLEDSHNGSHEVIVDTFCIGGCDTSNLEDYADYIEDGIHELLGIPREGAQ